MDKIEFARELFQKLEGSVVQASEVARRAFCIHERLATIRG